MPFIPHTDEEIQDMLSAIAVDSIENLFDEIPQPLRIKGLEKVPSGISEMEVTRLMSERANENGQPICFLGAGASIYATNSELASWQAFIPFQLQRNLELCCGVLLLYHLTTSKSKSWFNLAM